MTSTQTEHGYLVLADISGYTSYLAKVELDHAHEILTDLLAGIVDQLKLMMTISKLEGDAVFATVLDNQLPRPEALLEIIETTYLAFRQRRDSSQRRTTCTCRACQSIPLLDLKFFVHYGDFIVQNISGIRELVGSDVNLVHRLMKNHITEATGWKAYILFTRAALDEMGLCLDNLHEQIEAYEHLGDIQTVSIDLHVRYDSLMEIRHTVISPQEADLSLSCELAATTSLVWQLITDPQMFTQTMREGGRWSVVGRPGGRAGIGARNHCAHGKGAGMEYLYLDWRPFEYFTAEAQEGRLTHREMFLIEPSHEGAQTRLTVRLQLSAPMPRPIRRVMCSLLAKKMFLEFFERSRSLLAKMDVLENRS